MAVRRSHPPAASRLKPRPATYTLVVRGPDGRPHFERFDDAAAYLARLMALRRSAADSVSIEDIIGLLDA
jgi:hypothetical protein